MSLRRLTTVHRPLHSVGRRLLHTNRAITYTQNGSPASVLRVSSYPALSPPQPDTLNIRFLLSPVNPADVNVVEGVYPSKPAKVNLGWEQEEEAYVGGNEGVAVVTSVGGTIAGLKKGDWVVMTKPQVGTWCSERNVSTSDVLKVKDAEDKSDGLSEVFAATMTVNPPTAYNMLRDFVKLQPGDWIIQNGANGAVGQAVIQIAKALDLKTINFIRDRPNTHALEELKYDLRSLGANHVYTYSQLEDIKSMRTRIKEITEGRPITLALNCVGGPPTTHMSTLLAPSSTSSPFLVTYGAMSKQPLSLPTGAFIFKNLTSVGFWQTRWYKERSQEDKAALVKRLTGWAKEGKLQPPAHRIHTISSSKAIEDETEAARQIVSESGSGKKVLLKFD